MKETNFTWAYVKEPVGISYGHQLETRILSKFSIRKKNNKLVNNKHFDISVFKIWKKKMKVVYEYKFRTNCHNHPDSFDWHQSKTTHHLKKVRSQLQLIKKSCVIQQNFPLFLESGQTFSFIDRYTYLFVSRLSHSYDVYIALPVDLCPYLYKLQLI